MDGLECGLPCHSESLIQFNHIQEFLQEKRKNTKKPWINQTVLRKNGHTNWKKKKFFLQAFLPDINDHSMVQQKSSRKDQVVLQQRVILVKNHTSPASLDMVSELSARNAADLAD